tara:strand:- start:308 stop:445 length:138 start_codon:yes stop_codon:yes gene_type:complete
MNTLGYANREEYIMGIFKTIFEGVVFFAALVTLCAWMFALEALIQ